MQVLVNVVAIPKDPIASGVPGCAVDFEHAIHFNDGLSVEVVTGVPSKRKRPSPVE